MELIETSKQYFEQNTEAKTEGNAWIRFDGLNSRTGGSRRGRRSSKRESVSDLEAEETKGFIDLGFVFTEEDLNSELPDILPGLRTFLCREEQRRTESSSVPRPYLSETWDFYKWSGRTEKYSMVIDFRMAKLCGENNMKESLKCWARSVASNLK